MFGAGVSLGMFAGILIGSLVTWWLGEAAIGLLRRMFERKDRVHLELLLQ